MKQLKMHIQTKCTLVIISLFIIELLPVPFSALYSLYAIRKLPDWLPRVTDKLYGDKAELIELTPSRFNDAMALRKKCTLNLAIMFVVDLLVPVIIPTALYVVRKRPAWFKSLIIGLYADKLPAAELITEPSHENPELLAHLQQRLGDLDEKNRAFAKSLAMR